MAHKYYLQSHFNLACLCSFSSYTVTCSTLDVLSPSQLLRLVWLVQSASIGGVIFDDLRIIFNNPLGVIMSEEQRLMDYLIREKTVPVVKYFTPRVARSAACLSQSDTCLTGGSNTETRHQNQGLVDKNSIVLFFSLISIGWHFANSLSEAWDSAGTMWQES